MTEFPAGVYTRPWRLAAASFMALSGGSLPILLGAALVANDPPIGVLHLLQLVALFALLPALLARAIRRACAARIGLGDGALIARRADLVVEVPCAAIARVTAWTVPLPSAGLTLWTRSGKRLRYAIAADDPLPLADALAAIVGSAVPGATTPSIAYAHAAAAAPWRWYHYGWKFVLFSLVPTAVFFNAHQHIAYGGPLGEYHLLGLASYLRTFVLYWVTLAIYLVLFAAVWRGVGEGAALAATWAAPSRAARVRHVAEVWCRVLYYGGVPALVALRFLT